MCPASAQKASKSSNNLQILSPLRHLKAGDGNVVRQEKDVCFGSTRKVKNPSTRWKSKKQCAVLKVQSARPHGVYHTKLCYSHVVHLQEPLTASDWQPRWEACCRRRKEEEWWVESFTANYIKWKGLQVNFVSQVSLMRLMWNDGFPLEKLCWWDGSMWREKLL